MTYTKANMRAVDRYVKANYDRIELKVPKGRKLEIEDFASNRGQSVNALINSLIRNEMGLSVDEWKTEKEVKSIPQLRRILNDHGYGIQKKHRGKDSWLIIDNSINVVIAGYDGSEYVPGLTTEEVQKWVNDQEWN